MEQLHVCSECKHAVAPECCIHTKTDRALACPLFLLCIAMYDYEDEAQNMETLSLISQLLIGLHSLGTHGDWSSAAQHAELFKRG